MTRSKLYVVFVLLLVNTVLSVCFAGGYTKISAGFDHTLALKSDGSLWAWGYNAYGQLGDISKGSGFIPKQIGTDFKEVSTSSFHTLALKNDGTLWVWGANINGALGPLSTGETPSFAPQRIFSQIGTDFKTISTNVNHSLALKSDGSLWAWGTNTWGQVGDGTTDWHYVAPKLIGSDFTVIAAGYSHSVALKSDGSLWAWGDNSFGQLGDGTKTSSFQPKQIGTDFKAIAAGYLYTLALKTDGSLWAWGDNRAGQLGDASTTESVIPKQIGTGFTTIAINTTAYSYDTSYNVALKADGSLWAWGNNNVGQLGDGTTMPSLLPKQIGSGFTAASAGGRHTVALKADGSLWAWGSNNWGQLGEEDVSWRLLPESVGTGYSAISAGSAHSLALKIDGSLWAWGAGALGDGSTQGSSLPKQIVSSGFSSIAAGSGYSLALTPEGNLWAWGTPFNLDVGYIFKILLPSQVDTGYRAVSTTEFFDWDIDFPKFVSHIVAVKTDASLSEWYSDNSQIIESIPGNFSVVSAGGRHTLALKSDGSLWAWGQNSSGQLGDGSFNDSKTPQQIGTDFKAIASGSKHSLGLKNDGSLWAWGNNDYGQLGDGSKTTSLVPKLIGTGFSKISSSYEFNLALKNDGSLWSWGLGLLGHLKSHSDVPLQIGTGFSAISAGKHSMALKSDSSLWTWGNNDYGQLGDGTTSFLKNLSPRLIDTGTQVETPENAIYDTNYRIVTIQDVQIQNEHYQLQLSQMPNSNLWELKSAQLLSEPRHKQPGFYDPMTMILTLPTVRVQNWAIFDRDLYQAALTNIGNYVFRLDLAKELNN